MPMIETMSATDFKAKCLDVLDRIHERRVERVSITKRGQVVAVLLAPPSRDEQVEQLQGSMRGSVVIPEGFDLTAPLDDVEFDAGNGILHR